MKILQVMAGAEHGGAEIAFVDMCIALKDSHQIVEVITRDNDIRVPMLRAKGIKVHTLRFGGRLDFKTPRGIAAIAKEFQPDIIQTWMSRAARQTPRWRESMKIPRYLVVSRLGGYYKIKYFKNTDYFMTITPDIMRHLVDNGVAPNRIRHINNFAETESIAMPVKRAEMETPEDAVVLLGLGRLHTSKGFDTLIKAAASLPDNVYLWIAGEGPQRAELEQLIVDLQVSHRVRLLGWRSDRAALLRDADICVFSSRYEPFGTVFVQAWAQKTPLITTDADGPRQFVRDGEDGLMVGVDDAKGIQEAVLKLMQDKALSESLVERGYERYLNEFTKDKTVSAYLEFYQQILERENITPSARKPAQGAA